MTEAYTVVNPMSILNSTFENVTQRTMSSSGSSSRLGIAILSLAFIIGFPGNAFIIWTVLARMKKRTVTCLLIFHLSMADMIVILTAPFFLHFLDNGTWVFGQVICKMCHYIGCLSMYASIFLISFMSMDRFLAVAKPFTSQIMRTKTAVRVIVLVIWLLACLLSIPMPIYRTVIKYHNASICIPYHRSSEHIVFQYLFETMVGFFIPFTIIVICYLYICLRLRTAKFQSKHKTNRLVVLIVATFLLFWLPYHVVNILQVTGALIAGPAGENLLKAARKARPNVTALAFLSSSANPVLYAYAGGSFIKTAGIGFMAKLFEGTNSEVSSFRKVSQAFSRQRSRNESIELGKLGEAPEESKTFSTNQ